ncbi:MFS transporter [Acinetobacter guillouiae]|jgi:predicted MFS family arabinose efflux permease|nr:MULTISPECIES: MFS transporter [Acinetobacter]MBK5647780.1 MFS transporter [Acinetobacter sp.]EPH38674.1 Putative transport protein [Acinetobacter guillouiae MSP4-18]KAB0629374.1 MFS transporter [Acinetobacter guillouiae]MBP2546418.1 putative MFS family arabinose efflux permease [Acinetobacter guillouiae]MCF0264987.1 MFS transporter [Acinetobacter guillouiae]
MMNPLERRSTFALSSIFALRMLGLFMIIPVFAVVGQSYQYATPALIGLAVGVYGLSQALLQIPFSLWADRFSRKPLIVFGLLLFALGGAVAAMSETIYGVIIGRAIAGAGAVSAVVMALLADVTREENRTKAMAVMGMSIGLSFVVAFSLGPWLTSLVGISGLFWVTTIMGLLAILMLFMVPKTTRHHKNFKQGYLHQLKQVLKMGDLNRLHVSVFALHLLLTAMFVYVPSQLINFAGIPLAQHGIVYLPLLVISLFFAFPSIILAEKYRKMRSIFLTAIAGIIAGLVVLIFGYESKYILLLGLGLFFIAFNVMEALLPSWLSKAAPIQSKATAMGVNASAQFLGAFFGGTLGGQLILLNNTTMGWSVLSAIAILWLLISFGLAQPRYLTSIVLRLPEDKQTDNWTSQLLSIRGIEEVVVMSDQQVAYIKVDKQQIDDAARQHLTQLFGKEVAI